MEDREEKFLKRVFKDLEANAETDSAFESLVFHKITHRSNFGAQVFHYLRIAGPILFVLLLAGILILIFKGNVIVEHTTRYLPYLKPWHIFMAIIIIYFHFVRSVLILAFLYFKKYLRGVFSFTI